MRVAILHYHLKPGGVTRVIENTVRELNRLGIESLVFCSEAPESKAYPFDNVRVIPGLAYADRFVSAKAETLKEDLESGCRAAWGGLPDLWHIHNHSLAKNLELPVVVSAWAREGQKLLLQIHDLAEDGRPENYQALLVTLAGKDPTRLNEILYPTGDHIAYAFINGRDRNFFVRSGVDESRCHLLANPIRLEVEEGQTVDDPELQEKRFILYPTRSIRRKNMGEMLLWAAAAGKDTVFGSTLAPANPTALPIYRQWVKLSDALHLPVRFGLGESHNFHALLNTADALLTTSIAEGFGLAYLEPFLIPKPLLGRDLPEITAGFKETGIQLDNLYPRLDVPVGWIGRERLRKKIHDSLVRYYQSYRQVFQKPMTALALDAIVRDDTVDFGYLDEAMQETVIRRVAHDPAARLDLAPEKLEVFPSAVEMEKNADLIRRHFNPEQYGLRLKDIYTRLSDSEPARPEFLDTQKVLDGYLDPARFNLLRT